MAKKIEYNLFVGALWRFLRVSVAAGIAQVAIVTINFSDPKEIIRAVLIAFITGFFAGADKYLREQVKRI